MPPGDWIGLAASRRIGTVRTARRTCAPGRTAALVCAALLAVGAPATSGAAQQRRPVVHASSARTGCTGVRLTSFRFQPPSIATGGSTTLEVAVANCTGRAFTGALQTSGFLVCIAIDPLRTHVQVAAGKTWRHGLTLVAPSCTGTGRMNGVVLNASGHKVAARTATLVVT
jgi:hypothetical protein